MKKLWARIKSFLTGVMKGLYERFDKKIMRPVFIRVILVLSRRVGPGAWEKDAGAEWKGRVLQDFRLWLAEIPDSPPSMEAASPDSCDLYTLLSEFSALRQEIRFQNREQARATRGAEIAAREFEQARALFESGIRGIGELQDRIRRAGEKDAATRFFDVRDALVRGKAASRKVTEQKSFLRLMPKGLDGVLEGYEMAIRRFDLAMEAFGIEPVETPGKTFDPKTMKAIEKQSASNVEPGTVIEEVSGGFIRGGEVLKTARVIVAD